MRVLAVVTTLVGAGCSLLTSLDGLTGGSATPTDAGAVDGGADARTPDTSGYVVRGGLGSLGVNALDAGPYRVLGGSLELRGFDCNSAGVCVRGALTPRGM